MTRQAAESLLLLTLLAHHGRATIGIPCARPCPTQVKVARMKTGTEDNAQSAAVG